MGSKVIVHGRGEETFEEWVDREYTIDYLISKNDEEQWTILQGEVYGKEILRASFYPGLLEALNFFNKNNHRI